MAKINIRAMERGDIDAVVRTEREAFPSPWTKDVFYRQLLNPGRRRLLVAEREREVIGHLAAWLRARYVHITSLAVRETFRRQGVATALVEKIMKDQHKLREEIRLEVRVSNQPARSLYRSLGFLEIDQKEDYYMDNGETALVLSYTLTDTVEAATGGSSGEISRSN